MQDSMGPERRHGHGQGLKIFAVVTEIHPKVAYFALIYC
jgi:hypothetical protein